MFAFYNKSVTKFVLNSIKQKQFKIQSFFKNINIKEIYETEFEGINNVEKTFVNINTKNDVKNLRKLIKN